MFKLNLIPNKDGYSYQQLNDVISDDDSIGKVTNVKDFEGSCLKISINFSLNQTEYRYFRLFYHFGIHSGSSPFIMDLVIENDTVSGHEVNMEPNSLNISQQGLIFNVSFNIYAVPARAARDVVYLDGNYFLDGALYLTGRHTYYIG